MNKVSVLKTEKYEENTLNEAVSRHFEALEIESLIKPGMKVLIKPNLLAPRKPESAVTTNPLLVKAVVNWLNARGVKDIVIADSPGGPYVAATLKTVYSSCGYSDFGDMLNYDTTYKTKKSHSGKLDFNILTPVTEADLIINMPKLKTHALTVMSAGVKNLFGVIPGLQKPEMHYRYPNLDNFSDMLTDLALTVAPAVTLMDAIEGMEGEGPNAGTPIFLGYTLASRDIFAIDVAAARILGLDPMTAKTVKASVKNGLVNIDEIVTAGDEIVSADALLPKSTDTGFLVGFPKIIKAPLSLLSDYFLKPYPKVDSDKCIGCGKCAESCPPKIIKIKNKKAVFVKKGCISCFCCQEMCPAKVIHITRRLAGRKSK